MDLPGHKHTQNFNMATGGKTIFVPRTCEKIILMVRRQPLRGEGLVGKHISIICPEDGKYIKAFVSRYNTRDELISCFTVQRRRK